MDVTVYAKILQYYSVVCIVFAVCCHSVQSVVHSCNVPEKYSFKMRLVLLCSFRSICVAENTLQTRPPL